MKIKPRFLPRNIVDIAVGIVVAAYQCTLLLLMPFFVVLWLTHSFVLAAVVFGCAYSVFLLFSVREMIINEHGLTFVRVLGHPRCIAWDQLKEVTEAPRKELIFKGWVWPLFPAREMTASLSSTGHYRISWSGDWCYFPPKDPGQFFQAIQTHHHRS